MPDLKREKIEMQLLIDGIFTYYGYDFRNYAKASLKRRIKKRCDEENLDNISDLIPLLLHDKAVFNRFLRDMSVTVTEMFRDPLMYKTMKEKVFPRIENFPYIKIWHAGCATGEEVYSMAILLKEYGIYDKCHIYATDYNNESIESSTKGIFPIGLIQEYSKNYLEAGGAHSLSNYYHARYNSVIFNKSLKKNITFAHHNLVTDYVFTEAHLIVCRNVLIYFDNILQNRVFNLFTESLNSGGFLCLGTRETIDYSEVSNKFRNINGDFKIYQLNR